MLALNDRVGIRLSEMITHIPPILTVSCVYSSSSQPDDVIRNLLFCAFRPSIHSSSLSAFVCYRGAHYICFCKEYAKRNNTPMWVEYDDCNKKYFSGVQSLVSYCLDTHSLPVLLLFSKVSSQSLSPIPFLFIDNTGFD